MLVLPGFGRNDEPGVIVAAPNDEKPRQSLVFCPPVSENSGRYQYLPAAVVVASNPEQDGFLDKSRMLRYSKSFERCDVLAYGGNSRIFNMVIRDLDSSEQRLLLTNPAQITSLDIPDPKCDEGEGEVPCNRLLWQIRNRNSNGDGRINGNDALVAYASDLDATTLDRLTPLNASVASVAWLPQNNRWQFRIRRDTNEDGTYEVADGAQLLEGDVDGTAKARPFIDDQVMDVLRAVVE